MVVAGDVRRVDAGVGEHGAVAVSDHQHAFPVPYDLGRLAKDQLDKPRVLVDRGGQLRRTRRRRHLAQVDDPVFRLRYDLLRNHNDVAAPQRQTGMGKTLKDNVRDIVARPHVWNSRQRRNADLRRGPRADFFRRASHLTCPGEGR